MWQRIALVVGLCLVIMLPASAAPPTGFAAPLLPGSFAQGGDDSGIGTLLRILPDATNALVIVRAQSLKRSSIGTREGWAAKHKAAYAAGTAVVPPLTNTFVLGALIDLSHFKNTWSVAVLDMERKVDINSLSRTEGSLPSTVENYPVTRSQRGGYLVQFGPELVGVMIPGDRQALTRWLRSAKAQSEPVLSRYLREAASPDQPAQVIMALDVSDAIDRSQIRRGLDASETLTQNAGVDRNKLADLLCTLRGIRFVVRASDTLEGELTVDFAGSIDVLGDYAKSLLLEAIANHGLYVEDFDGWKPRRGERSFTLEGPLTSKALRRILTLVNTPTPEAASETSGNSPAGVDPKLAATRQYFNAVREFCADLRGLKSKKMSETATWYERYSQRIDQLPILNVDPDVLAWGDKVSKTLRALGLSFKGVAMQNTYLNQQYEKSANVLHYAMGYGMGSGFTGDSWNGWGFQSNAPMVTANLSKVEAIQGVQQSTKIQSKFLQEQVWTSYDAETNDLRKRLTLKYGIEF